MIRFFDVIVSLISLIILSPILTFLFFVGFFDTGKPMFCQVRVGRNCKPFKLVKFRTMKIGTAQVSSHLADRAAITSWGRILRRVKLDELPQLWNVLIGDMSLVGPRPCLFNQTDLYVARLAAGVFYVRPGITGFSQILGLDMSNPKTLTEMDLRMVKELNLRNYIKCILKTLAGAGVGDAIIRDK